MKSEIKSFEEFEKLFPEHSHVYLKVQYSIFENEYRIFNTKTGIKLIKI